MDKLTPEKINRRPVVAPSTWLKPAPFPGEYPTKYVLAWIRRSQLNPNTFQWYATEESYLGKLSRRIWTHFVNKPGDLVLCVAEFDRKNLLEKGFWFGGRCIHHLGNLELRICYYPLCLWGSNTLLGEFKPNLYVKRLKGIPFPYYSTAARLPSATIEQIRRDIIARMPLQCT